MSHAAVPPKRHHAGVIVLVVALALVVIGGGAYLFRNRLGLDGMFENLVRQPVAAGQDVTITVPEGSSGSTIVQQLVDAGVVSDSASFLRAVQKQNAEQSLKPGTYHFVTGSDPNDVVSQLVEGPNSTENQLKLAEGLTVSRTADVVESSLGISRDDFLSQAKASNYASDYAFLDGVQDDSLEGFLYGKTYDFSGKEQTPDSVIRMMLDQYANEVSSLDFASSEAAIKARYGVTMSDYDIIKMASIIEKEALTDDDRANISSVFYNRLAAGMALQSDATMGYVTGGEVSAEDLQQQSPYNTYLNKGLPPTPICSPSLASIQAALNPAQTNYYYFWITENDHAFSETYEQHQQAIANATSGSSESGTTGNGSVSTEG